ncbi:MAG: chemotaxis protein CheW [Gammaproteobacteria bacterium]|nr:chemotaxis protein CheW [Gammaproteobacteria bacterium]
MNEAGGEIYSLLVPLASGRLLVPRACVAEIAGYQVPATMLGAPPWYLGLVSWNGRQVPLVSFEGLCGQPIPAVSARTRMVVLHALGERLDAGAYALVSQGFPQLVRVSAEVIQPDMSAAVHEGEPVVCRVRMLNETPWIPDLERLEVMIADETSVAQP